MLSALGAARAHQHNFPMFLGVLLALCLLTVVIFVATATDDSPE